MQKSKDIFKIIFIILASTIFVLIVGLIILIFISKNEYKNKTIQTLRAFSARKVNTIYVIFNIIKTFI